jgi:hypothetical protein
MLILNGILQKMDSLAEDPSPQLSAPLDGQGNPATDMPLKGPAAIAGTGNLSTSGSSTTVTLPAADYTAILEGATLVANSLTRYVISKDGSNQVTVDTAVDWSTGYTFTRQNPITQFVESDGTIQGWMRADGAVYFVDNVGVGVVKPLKKLHLKDDTAEPLLIERDQAGTNLTGLLFKQPNTTDGNTLRIGYQTDTTGSGASTDVNFADIKFIASTHDQNTRTGEIAFYTAKGGVGFTEKIRLDASGNLGISTTIFGTSSAKVIGIANGTAPTTSPADTIQMWSADQAAGNACLHTRTEGGAVIKLYQQALIADAPGDTAANNAVTINAILDLLENNGLMANS